MRKGRARRLVIDASVMRAAGGIDATYPTSRYCRDVLSAVLLICHHAVVTQDIQEEWNEHQSRFAQQWRVSMVSRKKLHIISVDADERLRTRLERTAARDRDIAAMSKDYRLIEAALRTDLAIISRDDAVRALFAAAARTVRTVERIVWVNPDHIEERCADWLAEGAKPEPGRMLRSYQAR